MQRAIDVFFYGLFMDAALLRAKGLGPTNVRRGSVRGYGLRIGERASLVADDSSTAHGMVMSLPIGDVDALYSEPSVRAYRPEAVLVDLDGGGAVPALCFNLIDPPQAGERNAEYAAKLRALAERLGLPSAYTASIR